MASGGKGAKDTKVVVGIGDKNLTRRFIRPVERQRMRPWLIEHLDRNDIPGLSWQDQAERTFKISWKHAANQGFSMERDTNLFEKWAVHTGRHHDSDHKRWKANFRCALNSLPDVSELKDLGIKKGSNAFKVYKFLNEKETKTVKAAFKKKKAVYPIVTFKRDSEMGSEEEAGTATKEETDEGEDSEGDHNYAEYKLRLGHLQSGSAVVGANYPSLPLLEELASPSGVDLLLQAGSAESRLGESASSSQGFSYLKQILKAASESLSTKQFKGLSGDSLSEAISKHVTQMYGTSKLKLKSEEKSEQEEKADTTCVYKCIWCEKVCGTKVELFQHYLIDHQDNLIASASESDISADGKPDPKLQREIADLEKSVLGNYKTQSETVIEDGEVLDLSINNELSNKDMYIEEKALDLTVKKAPVRTRSEGLLDMPGFESLGKRISRQSSKDSWKGKRGKTKKVQSSSRKKRKHSKEEVDISDDGGDDDDDDDDDDCGSSSGSHGDMSRQHSREDFLHAEMLLSLKSCVGSQGEEASREGSPELSKKTNKRRVQKRKYFSNDSYESATKQSKNDAYMKNLDKIIKKVDRRISKSEKVIVESMESDRSVQNAKAIQKNLEEHLLTTDHMEGIQAAQEEKEISELNKEASQALKAVRGITKAFTEAQKEAGKFETLPEENKLEKTKEKDEENEVEQIEWKDKSNDMKPDLQSLLEASMISVPYRCAVCGLRYSQKKTLLPHLKSHCNYLPFKCGICGMTFEKASFLLRGHMKTHMLNRKYVCNKCGVFFSIPLQLIQHLATHENEDNRSGSDNKTDDSDGVNDESTDDLSTEKPYLSPFVCNLCDTSVSYGQELSHHVKRHYQEQVAVKNKIIIPVLNNKDDQSISQTVTMETMEDVKETAPTLSVKADQTDLADSDVKPSILAKALQSAPKYGNNLVVDKASGLIYHITNLPKTVKEYQSLSSLCEGESETKDKVPNEKQPKDSCSASQVMHAPVSKNSGSFPVLVRNPASSTWIVSRTKISQNSVNSSEKSSLTPLVSSDSSTSEGAKTLISEKADDVHNAVNTIDIQPVQKSSAQSIILKSAAGVSESAPVVKAEPIQNSFPSIGQESCDKVAGPGIIQSNQHDDITELYKRKADQLDKKATCIVQIAQGGVTQLVKIALPQTLQGTAVKPTQEMMKNSTTAACSQLQQNLSTQQLPLATKLMLTSPQLLASSIVQPKMGTVSQILQGLTTLAVQSTPIQQGPTNQVLLGGISQPSQAVFVNTAQEMKTLSGTGSQLFQAALNKSEQAAATPLATIIKTDSSQNTLVSSNTAGEQSSTTEPVHSDINIACMLQPVSLANLNTPLLGATAALNTMPNAITFSPGDLKSSVTDIPGSSLLVLKSLGEVTSTGGSTEKTTETAAINSFRMPLSNVNGGNQDGTATLVASNYVNQSTIPFPVMLSGQQLYGTGIQDLRPDSNKITSHSAVQSIAPQLILPMNTFGLQSGNQNMNRSVSSLSNDTSVKGTLETGKQSHPVLLNLAGVGELDTKAVMFLPGSTSSMSAVQNTLGGSVKKPKTSEITSQPGKCLPSVNEKLANSTVSTTSRVKPVTTNISLQTQIFQKEPGINNVLCSPTPNFGSTETDNSKLDISKLIKNSLKAAKTKAESLVSVALPLTSTSHSGEGYVSTALPMPASPTISGLSNASVLATKMPVTSMTVLPTMSTLPAASVLPSALSLPSVALSGTNTAGAQSFILNPVLQNFHPASIVNGAPQPVTSSNNAPQFSLPLIIRTSTGGGIATVQVGDKVYPLSLVFTQPLGSTSTVTTGTVSVATTGVTLSPSTVSVLTTSATAKPSLSSSLSTDSPTKSHSFGNCKQVGVPMSVESAKNVENVKLPAASLAVTLTGTDSSSQTDTKTQAVPKQSSGSQTSRCPSPEALEGDTFVSESNLFTSTSSLSSFVNETLQSSVTTPFPSSPDSSLHFTQAPLSVRSTHGLTKEEGLWLCSLCSRFFASACDLNNHIKNHKRSKSKDRIYKCDHCEAVFYEGNQMRQHNLTHFRKVMKDPDTYKCPRCDVELSHIDQLRYHCAWAHKDNTYPCQHCDKIFHQEVSLQAHAFQHPYLCKICQRRFDNRNAVEIHITSHECSSNVCAFCKEVFETKDGLKDHLVKCQKQKISARYLWLCDACKMPFSSKKKLLDHFPTHYSRTVYFCGLCQRAFLDAKGAQTHVDIHAMILTCRYCGDTFPTSTFLTEHMQRHLTSVHTSDLQKAEALVTSDELPCICDVKEIKDVLNIKSGLGTDDITLESHKETSEKDSVEAQTIKSQIVCKDKDKDENKSIEKLGDILQEKYGCSMCSLTQSSVSKLKQHKILAHSRLRRRSCETGQMETAGDKTGFPLKTSGKSQLEVTKNIDEDDSRVKNGAEVPQEEYSCSVCGLTQPSCFKLKQHKVMSHFFPRTNRNISYYHHVIENIKRPKLFSCKKCNKSFDLQSTLLWHMRFHKGKKYSCKVCRKRFDSMTAMKVHGKRVHTFPEPSETKLVETAGDPKDLPEEKPKYTSQDMACDDSDELCHSISDDGLQIDEENDDSAPFPCEVHKSVKEKLAQKCRKRKMKVVKTKVANNTSEEVQSKKQQRKKVFGCGVCKKSYFKLMKLTKHVWEHEQLESQGHTSETAVQKESVSMEIGDVENERKSLSHIKSDSEKQDVVQNEIEGKPEGKFMCSLCKIRYHDSAELFKHAKVHLGLAEIAAFARRKQKYAPLVTGDPSKPAIYIQLDEKGNLVRRIPAATDKNMDEGKGSITDDSGAGTDEKDEPNAVVVCNICHKTVDSDSDQTGVDKKSHNCTEIHEGNDLNP